MINEGNWTRWCGMLLLVLAAGTVCADWPQYMHNAARTGETAEDIAPGSLGLVARVALGDAILSSPIVVDGRCFVVDQMGTAYAVDVRCGTVLWSSSPEGADALGGNTSSPCYADGNLVYGTTSGRLHWLRASDGRVVRSIDLGWPVVSPVAVEHGHFYVATVDSSVHSFDRDGNLRWKWDHYQLAERWQDSRLHRESEAAHFGGAPVAVVGDRVLAPLGYDLVCLRDLGDRAKQLWQVNQPMSRFDVAMAVSSDGQYVYAAWPKSDGQGAIVRHRIADGQWDRKQDVIPGQWAVYTPPAVSGSSVFFSRHAFGVSRFDFSADRPPTEAWSAFENTTAGVQPTIAAVALTPRLVIMTTLDGDLRVVLRDGQSASKEASVADVYRFATPSRAMITSEPVVAARRIVFGSDDGCLYLIGTNDTTPGSGPTSANGVSQRSQAAGESSVERDEPAVSDQWPSAFGDGTNAAYVEDPAVKPPFRLRWAARSYGDFKHPLVAADGRVFSVSLAGLVVCRDQATGRVLWRVKLPGQAWSRASALAAGGKVFVPRVGSPRYAFVTDQPDVMICLDAASGQILWSQPIGRSDWLRASPLYADGVLAYGSKYETPRGAVPVIGPADRWRAAGEPEQPGWTGRAFDDAAWPERLFGSGARRSDPAVQAGQLQYLRRVFPLPQATIDQITSGQRQLGLVVGPQDQIAAFLNDVLVYDTPGEMGVELASSRYAGHAAHFVPLEIGDVELDPRTNLLAVAIRRARVRSNVSSSTSVFPPRLVLVTPGALSGPVIDAWDAQTGQPRWQIAMEAAGRYIEGPAGAARDGILYFTGGGSDPGGRGETVAVRAACGQRLWTNRDVYASRTGTPSLAGDLLILPGSHRLPLAALSIHDGRAVWQQTRWTGLEFVHAASVGKEGFTVNTKYRGGALLHDTTTGQRRTHAGQEIDLAGQGHTCGTIVLLASGYAVAATNRGIFFTDVETGEVVYQTPGFASQTCPNPAFAGGRMFYAPQDNGMVYCFEPVAP